MYKRQVEDGALNKSLSDIIDKYKADFNELFTIVKLQVNGGLGNALNQGLKVCRNELVARMDSDDISLPRRCEKELKLFLDNPELSIVGTKMCIRDRAKEKLHKLQGENSISESKCRLSFNDIAQKWFAYEKSKVKASTLCCYKNKLDNHIMPCLLYTSKQNNRYLEEEFYYLDLQLCLRNNSLRNQYK